MKKTAKTC